MAVPVVLGLALLNATAARAADGERPPEMRLQDQVRVMTGTDRGGPTGYRATNSRQRSEQPAGVAPIDQDQPGRARNLRFGVGYESRRGIGFSTSSPGAGAQRAGSGQR